MKTNIGIETTDEERERIAESLDLPHKLATRNDIKDAINEYVQNVLIGSEKARPETSPSAEATPCEEAEAIRDRSVRGFVPSRGDEDYLLRAKDPALKDLQSNLLDAIEALEEYTWNQLEKNRE